MIIFRRLAVLIAILASLRAPAQSRVVDTRDSVWASRGDVQWQIDSTAELLAVNDVSRQCAQALSMISDPAGLHVMSGEKCLVCGNSASGESRIELWQFASPGSLVLLDSRVESGRRFSGIAYDSVGGQLYVLDAGSNSLLRGLWDGAAPLTGIVLGAVADSSSTNFPVSPASWTMTMTGSGNPALVPYPLGPGLQVIALGGQVALVPMTVASGHDAYIVPVLASEGDIEVTAIALRGTVFEVIRLGVGTIGIGVGNGTDNPVTVPISEPLVLGERYVAQVLGQSTPSPYAFECVRRYGQSDVVSDGVQMLPFFYLAGAESGRVFNIQLALKGPISPMPRQYLAELLIGFRLPTDPVGPLPDGRYLLGPTYMFPVSGWIIKDAGQGMIASSVPIPNGLSDFVFLVQYAVYDGSEFRLSQIYGAKVH